MRLELISKYIKIFLPLFIILTLIPFAYSVNDPGHDSLYLQLTGGNLSGNLNVETNISSEYSSLNNHITFPDGISVYQYVFGRYWPSKTPQFGLAINNFSSDNIIFTTQGSTFHFNVPVEVDGDLDVSGNTSLDNHLTIGGDERYPSNLFISHYGDSPLSKNFLSVARIQSTSILDLFRIDQYGNVGIKRSTIISNFPSDIRATLDVTGDTLLDGNLNITGSILSSLNVSGETHFIDDVFIERSLNMQSNKITNLANGTSAQDAVTKSQLDAVSASIETDTNTQWNISGSNFLINESNILYVNETKLNTTYVPYSGATTHLNLGSYDLTATQITAAGKIQGASIYAYSKMFSRPNMFYGIGYDTGSSFEVDNYGNLTTSGNIETYGDLKVNGSITNTAFPWTGYGLGVYGDAGFENNNYFEIIGYSGVQRTYLTGDNWNNYYGIYTDATDLTIDANLEYGAGNHFKMDSTGKITVSEEFTVNNNLDVTGNITTNTDIILDGDIISADGSGNLYFKQRDDNNIGQGFIFQYYAGGYNTLLDLNSEGANFQGLDITTTGDICIDGGNCLSTVASSDTNTWWGLNEGYIYNNSNSLDFNETLLNTTIDSRVTAGADGYIGDARSHTAGGNLNMDSNNITKINQLTFNNDRINIGSGSTSSNTNSLAIGTNAIASGIKSTALNYRSEATGEGSVALSPTSQALGDYATTLGYGAKASGNNSIAILTNSEALATKAIAIGYYADSTNVNSIAIGSNTFASGFNSIAIGYNTNASAENSMALGTNTTNAVANSFKVGGDLTATFLDTTLEVGGAVDMNSNKITELANGTSSQDAVTKSQLDAVSASISDTWWGLNEGYIYNNSNSLDFNETLLNTTIDARVISGAGNVSSLSSTDNAIATYDGTDGSTIQSSGILITDDNNITNVNNLAFESYQINIGLDNEVSGYGLMAIGSGSTASGSYTIAIGNSATASANYATAIGSYSTEASGTMSSAFGYIAIASGIHSVSIGSTSEATNEASIALGYNSLSDSENSIAIGKDASAGGWYDDKGTPVYNTNAIAIGANTYANATNAIALGTATTNTVANSFKVGGDITSTYLNTSLTTGGAVDYSWNEYDMKGNFYLQNFTYMDIGGQGDMMIDMWIEGTSEWYGFGIDESDGRRFEFFHSWNGFEDDTLTINSSGAISIGGTLNMTSGKITNLANGTSSQDAVTLSQLQSVNSSLSSAGNVSSLSSTDNAIAIYDGTDGTTIQSSSFSINDSNDMWVNDGTITLNSTSQDSLIHFGNVADDYSWNIGVDNTDESFNIFSETYSLFKIDYDWYYIMLGTDLNLGEHYIENVSSVNFRNNEISLGYNTNGYANSIAIGEGADINSGNSIAIGTNTDAGGNNGVRPGILYNNSIAIGTDAQALETDSIAIGHSALSGTVGLTTPGQYSIAIGSSSTASQHYAIAIGYNTNATATSAIAIGDSSSASDNTAIAIGNTATANAAGTIAIGGYDTMATALNAISIGNYTYADGASSIAIGDAVWAQTNGSIAIGKYSWVEGGEDSIAIGTNSYVNADGAIALGNGTSNSVANSFKVGGSLTHTFLDTNLEVGGNTNISGNLNMSNHNITNIDDLGIGTSTPVSKIDIVQDDDSGIRLGLGNTLGTNDFVIYSPNDDAIPVRTFMKVDGTTSVSIYHEPFGNYLEGDWLFNTGLHTSGNFRAAGDIYSNGNKVQEDIIGNCTYGIFSIADNGTITCASQQTNDMSDYTGTVNITGELNVFNTSELVFKVNSTGSVFADGGYSSPATDLAEKIPTKDKTLKPGDVVIIDTANEESIKKSNKAYDRLVAGVISTKPGLMLGSELENSEYVALAGRVPVNVIGEVKIGDLLTTSNTPGFAMTCNEIQKCFGAILGKAMTNSKDGQVVALINLQ